MLISYTQTALVTWHHTRVKVSYSGWGWVLLQVVSNNFLTICIQTFANVVEHTFGVCEMKWRSLLKDVELSIR
jgi:hypothetical protein